MDFASMDTDTQTPEPSYEINETLLAAPAPSAVELFHRKRKHATAFQESTPSPAPQLLPTLAEDEDPNSSRPRLTISRHPIFTPVLNLPDFHNTDLIPYNRVGYRYAPAGLTPPGSTLLQRTIECNPPSARVSWYDRSPFLKVSQDGLSLAGDNGFRSARFNTPIREGKWFFEVKILQGGGDLGDGNISSEASSGAHVRLGFARREAPLNGPAGLDGYSYGIRDKTGEKVHISRPKPYGKPFGTGDVIGMYISLPPKREPNPNDPSDPAHLKRERIAIEFKGQEYFESLEYPQEKEMMVLMEPKKKAKAGDYDNSHDPSSGPRSNGSPTKKSATTKNTPGRKTTGRRTAASSNAPKTAPLRSLATLDDSYIAFFINGECQGVAFHDLYSYLPLPRESKTPTKRNPYNNPEGIREHKLNPFDDGTLGYYPFISLFNDAKVNVNVGPDFQFVPGDDVDQIVGIKPKVEVKSEDAPNPGRTWRPLHERYPEYMAEQWALDEREESEASAAVNQGYEPFEAPKKSRETKATGVNAPSVRAKRSGTKGKRARGGKKKDLSDRRSESVYADRSEHSTTPAVFGPEGEGYGTPGIDDDDRFGPGVMTTLSVPIPDSYPSPAVPDYASEHGDPSDLEEVDKRSFYQSEGEEDLNGIEQEFEQAASSTRYRSS